MPPLSVDKINFSCINQHSKLCKASDPSFLMDYTDHNKPTRT